MVENLVIVESPAKARTIGNFLGKAYMIKSSYGHIRDLSKENFGINIRNNFAPEYIVPDDKKQIVRELKKASMDARIIWLASDEDREGEAIAWHLCEVLDLDPQRTRRIVFHEITKDAIEHAISNPRSINADLVNAQQARRVLDRLVGFELSPILWKKVRPALSAGRVQSVAVKLIVERERAINSFKSESGYKVVGKFIFTDNKGQKHTFQAELSAKFEKKEEARKMLEYCSGATFLISEVTKKPTRKSPSPPFTTSTLQQEASRRLGFSVAQTMNIAQKLYESGKITYMRTDSVNLSKSALAAAKKLISTEWGEQYSKTRNFKTKTKGAQEAHEAIRPTYLDNSNVTGPRNEQRLYDLIWKRTISSQMSEALFEKTTVKIDIPGREEQFIVTGEVLKFDGFLKVYSEPAESDTEENGKGLLPPMKTNDQVVPEKIDAIQKFTNPQPRYTEASLVKKLEELGIGRPSTYAPTISTIQKREYVIKQDKPGKEYTYLILSLADAKITETSKTEMYGTEKAKLFPTDIGMLVNDFLVEHFKEILEYHFTADVEKEFDKIASGEMEWTQMIEKFYHPFHERVEKTTKISKKPTGERILGNDPVSGKPVSVKIGRFGPMVQIGNTGDNEKPRFASLLKGQSIETISLKEALGLFGLPRKIGEFEGAEMIIGSGKFGPYIKHKSEFYSLRGNQDDPLTIETDTAIKIIIEKRAQAQSKIIKAFNEDLELQILKGRWGPYIRYQKQNYKIPKGQDPDLLEYKDCLKIINTRK
jgi:DNA topoisomerase-1